jgi:uracil-DNA glycosylase
MPKLVFVAEAPTFVEHRLGRPFSSTAGAEFRRMLAQANLQPTDYSLLYAFNSPAPNDNMESVLVARKTLPAEYNYSAVSHGKYMPEKYCAQLPDLLARIADCEPTVVVPLGEIALWAVTGNSGIGSLRGQASLAPAGYKIIPTYSPQAVLRKWSLRTTCVFDLLKAARHAESKNLNYPLRRLLLEPTPTEAIDFIRSCYNQPLVSFDVETKRRTITCLGLSFRTDEAICIPFYDPRSSTKSFYSHIEEIRIWSELKKLFESGTPFLAQNGMYDIQYMLAHGIAVKNFAHDTMLMHHSLYSELPKGLGFLASIYTDEQPWKLIRNNDDFKENA